MRYADRATPGRLRQMAVAAMTVAVMAGSLLAMGTPASAIDKLRIDKTAIKATIVSGETAGFTIVATAIAVGLNNTVDNFGLTDQLSAGTWSVGGPDAAGCAIDAANLLSCNWGTVNEGTSKTITVGRSTTDADCGTTITNTANIQGSDLVYESGTDLNDNSSTATVTVTCAPPPPPSAKITPTGTTCQQFRDGTAADLNELLYGVRANGNIGNVAPGIGFYFVQWNGSPISIVQTDNGSTPPFGVQSVQVYHSSSCDKLTSGTTVVTGTTTTISIDNPAGSYIVRLAFDPNTVVGSPAPSPSTVVYQYTTNGVANSTDTVNLARK